MRIIHDVRVRVRLQLRLVAVLVVIWNGWMLEDQRAVRANEWLVRCLLFLEFVGIRNGRRFVSRVLRRRLALVHIVIVYVE